MTDASAPCAYVYRDVYRGETEGTGNGICGAPAHLHRNGKWLHSYVPPASTTEGGDAHANAARSGRVVAVAVGVEKPQPHAAVASPIAPECDCIARYAEAQRQEQIANCVTPAYHATHNYCPSCPWQHEGGDANARDPIGPTERVLATAPLDTAKSEAHPREQIEESLADVWVELRKHGQRLDALEAGITTVEDVFLAFDPLSFKRIHERLDALERPSGDAKRTPAQVNAQKAEPANSFTGIPAATADPALSGVYGEAAAKRLPGAEPKVEWADAPSDPRAAMMYWFGRWEKGEADLASARARIAELEAYVARTICAIEAGSELRERFVDRAKAAEAEVAALRARFEAVRAFRSRLVHMDCDEGVCCAGCDSCTELGAHPVIMHDGDRIRGFWEDFDAALGEPRKDEEGK